MNLGFDVSSAVDTQPTGVARYIRLLVESMEAHNSAPRLFCRPSRRRVADPSPCVGGRRVASLGAIVPGCVPPLDIFHGLDGRLPRFGRRSVRRVVTVHDLSAFERDDHATKKFLRRKRARIHRAVLAADAVITHSQVVADAIADRFEIPKDRCHAVPLASTLAVPPSPAREPSTTLGQLLVVGGPSRRKRSDRIGPLLEVLEHRFDLRPRVEWVGSGSAAEFQSLAATLPPATAERLHFLGHVSDAELAACYDRADAFIQLSDTEGFAIPLLEACERGCAVLSIDAPVLRETCGSAGFYAKDLGDPGATELHAFVRPEVRAERIARGHTHAAEFTWARTARRTLEVYRSLFEPHSEPR
ncbi:MAG: glycosyltransferase [Planctomycetota bacterium]